IGGTEEVGASRQLAGLLVPPPADLTGKLTLAELSAFLSGCLVRALVSADSGPVHIAWICQKPVVALFAKDAEGCNPVRWGPRGRNCETIFKSMDRIAAEEVYLALLRVMGNPAGVL
ncbi:MAG: glycosyltransferase family 9 protein, partial [Candidatus Omnitrophota bacterium]